MEMGFLAFSAVSLSEQLKLFTFDCFSSSNLEKAFYSTFVTSRRLPLYFSLRVSLLQSTSVLENIYLALEQG